jgi:hypothetical protein
MNCKTVKLSVAGSQLFKNILSHSDESHRQRTTDY